MTVKPGDPLCWNTIGVHGDGSCPELKTVIHCRSCPVFSAAGRALFDREPPAGYLQEWATTLAAAPLQNAAATQSAVIFRLGREWLALPTALFVEVSAMKKPRRIAHRSTHVLTGIVNIRGQIELCVSLRSLLHIEGEAAETERRRLLVVERDQERWAFDADEVDGVHRYAVADLGPVPSTVHAPAAGGSAATEEGGDSVRTHTRALIAWGAERAALLDDRSLWNALRRGVE